ncbi:porin family protein [Archangium gephyra]|nr:porin family protein [Archangium gephyra]
MRTLRIALLALAITGCETTSGTGRKTTAERTAELQRYREQKAAEEEARQKAIAEGRDPEEAVKEMRAAQAPATPETPAAAATPASPETPATPATSPVAPAAPALPVGPRMGLFGLRASLLGSTLGLGESAGTSSTVGVRYFFTETVGVDLDAGFAYASVGKTSVTGLSLGVGLNAYGGAPGKALRPFFSLAGSLSQVGAADTSASVLTLAAGGGLEYWIAPQLSVSTSLMLGLATVPNADTLVIGTIRPGLGVTLYTE